MELCYDSVYMSSFQPHADYNAARFSLPQSGKDGFLEDSCAACHSTARYSKISQQPRQEHRFFNGDIYVGSWQGSLPEGRGKYLWVDGCMYEGEWRKGKKSGKGKLSWPSGATYEGDFLAGFIQGVGTYMGVDGTTYTGDWFLSEKIGFGTKSYSNGDFYEGSWKKGLPEGAGRYVWKNGNMYIGEWIAGVKSGRGTLMWACGDKYDGEWLNGLMHGQGVYTWADTSTYTGTWSKGLKDGRGTFIPSGIQSSSSFCVRRDSSQKKETNSSLFPSARGSPLSNSEQRDASDGQLLVLVEGDSAGSESSTSSDSGPEDCPSFERSWSLDESFDRFLILDDEAYVLRRQDSTGGENDSRSEQETLATTVIERHYVQGVLVNELIKDDLRVGTVKPLRPQPRSLTKQASKAGERIIKGHQSYELMLNLQLGIRYAIGRKNSEPICYVSSTDFGPKARVRMSFPRQGSQLTPSHQSTDFKWKDYCPAVFRHLRKFFKIDTVDFMLSICGDGGLRELSSPGKSGSVFYLSHDDRFMIKTLRKTETKVLLGMLQNYYNHVRLNENTLITKFLGLHRIKTANGQKVRFVVMSNMFCSNLGIHRRFDLKGSSQGRSVDKPMMDETTTTLKDLDLNFVFRLEPSLRQALIRQVECDCMFLKSERIMDYSLLLGLHFCAPQTTHGPSSFTSSASEAAILGSREGVISEQAATSGSLLHLQEPLITRGVPLGACVQGIRSRVGSTDHEEMETTRLGVSMPAKADYACTSSKQECNGGGHDVLLYFGIIDILQRYDISKKLERAYKSIQYDSRSISAVDPSLYSRRFRNFIRQTFLETGAL